MEPLIPRGLDVEKLRFDPVAGTVVRTPEGEGYGFWAGGHKVFFDDQTGQFVMFYRLRSPLEAGRGARCAIATSDDGIEFRDVWTATKEQFAANSIEVGHCVRDTKSGEWRLYVSYELRGGPWRVDLIRAPTIAALDVQSRRTVLQPFDYGLRSLKDPVVYQRDGRYFVYVAGPGRTRPTFAGNLIKAGAYEATFLAESADGIYFPELQYAFEATNEDTWDGRRARINSVVRCGDGFLGIYDGGRTSYDMYEEWCGIAWSPDGRRFEREPLGEPWVRSPYGSVRYVYTLRRPDAFHFYYEYTREDLSHDLRVSVVAAPEGL
ncbi:MAG: hypothetical protein ACE5EF_01805 [Dehalococcoidia bacterium]